MAELMLANPPSGTPLWWLVRLEKKLRDRQREMQTFDDYYRGKHPLGFAGEKFLKAFGGRFAAFADNWCDLPVDAVRERLKPVGFRFGEDPKGDGDAWRIWQDNQLDADSQLAHTEALVKTEASAIVWIGADDRPEITIEDPMQVIVECEPGRRRRRAAALKMWKDDWEGRTLATLYLPDGIYKFRSAMRQEWTTSGSRSRWVRRDVDGEDWPLPNPLGVVPVVPLLNRPRLTGQGDSEIRRVIPIQNAVNKLVADMMVASEYQAFRQRWLTGHEIPVDPETNQPVEEFKAAVDRIFVAEETDARFGEFGVADLANFVKGIEMLVQHIASQTRTPPHYFALSGQFPSGESIKSAETGLVAKAREKMTHFGEGWEEILRLAFAVLDDPRADQLDAETIWADPESRSEAEHVDATLKKKALNVPDQQLWEDLGYSPQQIARFEAMSARQLMRTALFSGIPTLPPAPLALPPAPPAA